MRFPLFGVGQRGKSPNVTAQSRNNLYLDVQPQEDKTQISLHSRPALSLFAEFGDEPIRGMLAKGTLLYVVHRGTLWEVNNAGAKTSRGSLSTTSGRVEMAYNRHANGQVMIVDGTAGYIYTESTTTLAVITDVDYIDAATTVSYHDGYFIVESPNTARFYISAIDDGTSWDSTDFATAEKSPDPLSRVVDNGTEILLMGTESVEMWNNTGDADFPYTRVTGGVIELGLAAKWSVARFAESSIICLAANHDQGDVKVIRIEGFRYTTVSNPEIDSIFNTYTTGDATSPVGDGHKIIAHICNDIGGWGKGFVVAISRRWPEPESDYRRWYAERDQNDFGLGAIRVVSVADDLSIANMIGQHDIRRRSGTPPIRYDAVRSCLSALRESARSLAATVHMPRIGCGLAGGDWSEIEPIIHDELSSHDVAVSVYDFL